MSHRRYPRALLMELAVEAGGRDPRSVAKRLRGEEVRGAAGLAIDRVLRQRAHELNLAPYLLDELGLDRMTA